MTKAELVVLLDKVLGEQARKYGAWMSPEHSTDEGERTTYDGDLVLSEVAEAILKEMSK